MPTNASPIGSAGDTGSTVPVGPRTYALHPSGTLREISSVAINDPRGKASAAETAGDVTAGDGDDPTCGGEAVIDADVVGEVESSLQPTVGTANASAAMIRVTCLAVFVGCTTWTLPFDAHSREQMSVGGTQLSHRSSAFPQPFACQSPDVHPSVSRAGQAVAMSNAYEVWNTNIDDELSFWRGALGRDDQVGRELRERAEIRPLQRWVRDLIRSTEPAVRVLDVGSGPLTTLGSTWPERGLEVVAVDPLGDEYNVLLAELGLVAPVRPVRGQGEALSDRFGQNVFDFVLAANSLDHCADPVIVIAEMVAVAKPGAVVFMNHLIDVADHESHAGLHQWNLRPVNGDMVIEGYGSQTLLSEIVPGCTIEIVERGTDFLASVVKGGG